MRHSAWKQDFWKRETSHKHEVTIVSVGLGRGFLYEFFLLTVIYEVPLKTLLLASTRNKTPKWDIYFIGSVAIESTLNTKWRDWVAKFKMGSKPREHGCLCRHRDFINYVHCNCSGECSNKQMKLPLSFGSKEYWSIFPKWTDFAMSQERSCLYEQLKEAIK